MPRRTRAPYPPGHPLQHKFFLNDAELEGDSVPYEGRGANKEAAEEGAGVRGQLGKGTKRRKGKVRSAGSRGRLPFCCLYMRRRVPREALAAWCALARRIEPGRCHHRRSLLTPVRGRAWTECGRGCCPCLSFLCSARAARRLSTVPRSSLAALIAITVPTWRWLGPCRGRSTVAHLPLHGAPRTQGCPSP